MLTALILPLIGTGIGLVLFGIAAHRLVAHHAPKILEVRLAR